ncbi:hypothetical protein [Prauserella cavernicola]|uniref:Uncharacterized protein n=1 Tax=Prauserella cavernicola TaxID=2800127 RepID=A0A934QTC6_9PSEU|nr:hypothetical protein [Prauserella cavernicola]MBK1785985.1 hypothetical protein [Prauserella cavernicola]
MSRDEREVVLSAEQCAEIASALADDDTRKAEVMLYAAQHPHEELTAEESFTEQERQWAMQVRALRPAAEVELGRAVERLDAAVHSEVRDLIDRNTLGDGSATGPLRTLGVHLLERSASILERAGLPLDGLDIVCGETRARVETLVSGAQVLEVGSWAVAVDELRDLADAVSRASANFNRHVKRVQRQGSTPPTRSVAAHLPRRQWEALEAAFDDMCSASDGDVEPLHDRARGILETLRPRSLRLRPQQCGVEHECYEVIGALSQFVDGDVDDPQFRRELGHSLIQLGGSMSAGPDEPPAPTGDVEAMIRRIDRAVDADVTALYARTNAGDDTALPLLRRRAFHLLELGICEAGEAGIDVGDIETAVEVAFEVSDR